MQHLNDEDLARLVDEEASEAEASHLAACQSCSAELRCLREQHRDLAAMPELQPPAAGWAALAPRLQAEGLLASRPAGRRWSGRPALRAAAAAALFLAGAGTGAVVRGAPEPIAPSPRDSADAASAERRLRDAEAAYLAALAQYAEATGTAGATDPLNRLAALEGIVLTTRAALNEAPADPVINGYHLAAVGQRDALLRQIGDPAEQGWY